MSGTKEHAFIKLPPSALIDDTLLITRPQALHAGALLLCSGISNGENGFQGTAYALFRDSTE